MVRKWGKRGKRKGKDEQMTDNGIGVEGAKVMSEMMEVNTTLTSLNMSCEEEIYRERRRHKQRNT